MCWRLEIWAPPWSWLVRPASPKCVPAYPRNCFYTGYRPNALYCIGFKCNTLYYVCLAVPASSYAQVISPYSGGQPIPRLSSHIGSRLLRLSYRPWARCRGDREGSLLKRISALHEERIPRFIIAMYCKIFVAKTFRIKHVNRVNFQIRDKCA